MNNESKQPEAEFLPTRWTLIDRLKRWDDDGSWREFFEIYWRLIHGTALKSGCTEDEALEVVQETVISVAKEMKKDSFQADQDAGSFKGWLLRITQRRIVDQLRKRPPQGRFVEHRPNPTLDTATIDRIADPKEDPAVEYWDREWEQHLLDAAIQRVKQLVKPGQFQVFQLLVIKKFSTAEVAKALNMNAAQVYLAKHRVGLLVKRELKKLQQRLC